MSIFLPNTRYDVVGSIVVYKTDLEEIEHAVRQFLAIPLTTHLCVLDNSPTPLPAPPGPRDRVTYFHTGSNLGYGRAHNIALRAAAGKSRYSLVMNTDIEYVPQVVTQLVQFMDAHPRAGLTAPKVLYPGGALQYVCRLLPTPANLFLRRFLPRARWTERADALYELRWWDHHCVANIPYFQGSFLMLKTDLCNSLGGFDERFFLYGEDIDLSRRIYEVAQALYIPTVQITHQYRRYSNRSLRGTWIGVQNNARYFNKWGWFFDAERRRINRRVVADLLARQAAQRPIQVTE